MPRSLALLLAFATWATPDAAHAGVCGTGQFRVDAPQRGQGVPRNVHVLVSASGPFQGLLEGAEIQFVAETPVVAGTQIAGQAGAGQTDAGPQGIGAKVVLRVGGPYVGQWLLAPTTDLLPNTRYHLAFAQALVAQESDRGALRDMNERSLQAYAFTTRDDRDDAPPVWARAPRLGRYEYSGGPKGTVLNAFRVKVPLGPDFDGYVVAHVEARTRNENQAHGAEPTHSEALFDALFVVNGELAQVGRLDCDSVFSPTRGTYAVTLSAIDSGGNPAPAPGKPLLFWFGKP